MAKDPAFLFYTGDFTTGTQFMSDEQVGKYIRLLMAQHQHGRLSEKQVIFICKSFDSDIMCKFKKDDDGFFYNERLETEISKRKAFSDSRGNNKRGKTKDINKTSKSYDISSDNHMDNKDENDNKDEDLKENYSAKDFLKNELTNPQWLMPIRNQTAGLWNSEEHLNSLIDEFCELKQYEPFNDSRHRKNSFVLFVKNKFEESKPKNNSFGNDKPKQTTFDKLKSASEEARRIREERRAQSYDNGEESDFAHYTPVD